MKSIFSFNDNVDSYIRSFYWKVTYRSFFRARQEGLRSYSSNIPRVLVKLLIFPFYSLAKGCSPPRKLSVVKTSILFCSTDHRFQESPEGQMVEFMLQPFIKIAKSCGYQALGTTEFCKSELKKVHSQIYDQFIYPKKWWSLSVCIKYYFIIGKYARKIISILKNNNTCLVGGLADTIAYIYYTLLMLRILAKVAPCAVILIAEYGIYQSALWSAAQILGIPSIALQHGSIRRYHSGYRCYKFIKKIGAPLKFPDRFICWGSYFKELLTSFGLEEQKLLIGGNPNFDNQKCMPVKRSWREAHKNTRFVWFTQFHGVSQEVSTQYVKSVFNFFSLHPENELFLKPHPNEIGSIGYYENFLNDFPSLTIHILDAQSRSFEVLNLADVILVINSTVVYEAVLLGVPAIILNFGRIFPKDLGHPIFYSMDLYVEKEEEMEIAVRAALKQRMRWIALRDDFVKHFFDGNPGRCVQKIWGIIDNTIDGYKPAKVP